MPHPHADDNETTVQKVDKDMKIQINHQDANVKLMICRHQGKAVSVIVQMFHHRVNIEVRSGEDVVTARMAHRQEGGNEITVRTFGQNTKKIVLQGKINVTIVPILLRNVETNGTKKRRYQNKINRIANVWLVIKKLEMREKQKKQVELNEKYAKISQGVAQAENRQQKIKEMEQTVQESFTRHADDQSLNKHLKDQLLGEDDPMNDYMAKKDMKIKMKSESVYPTYTRSFPPNRYNIAPGYRWDGVDRSNGFESKMALRANRQKAEDSAAYRAVVELAE